MKVILVSDSFNQYPFPEKFIEVGFVSLFRLDEFYVYIKTKNI